MGERNGTMKAGLRKVLERNKRRANGRPKAAAASANGARPKPAMAKTNPRSGSVLAGLRRIQARGKPKR